MDIPSRHVVKPLLRKSLLFLLGQRGLQPVPLSEKPGFYFFPQGLLPANKIKYRSYTGSMVSVLAIGTRRGHPYHLAITFDIRSDLFTSYVAQLRMGIYLKAQDREKLITPSNRRRTIRWWNHEWLGRHLAVLSFLAEGQNMITIGTDNTIELESTPVLVEAPISIDDAKTRRRAPR
jgi:hypothetical protein